MRSLLPQESTPDTPTILPSLIIYPRLILDAIDLEYPTRGSRKPDWSIHLRFPGIYVHNYSRPRPVCSTSGMRDACPRGLDLSLAAIYEKALKRVVNKEKDKSKDKTTTEDNGLRNRVYPPVLYVWGDTDNKARQDKS